jgi:DNA-binding CsgD family transcriptional regulator
MDARRAPHHWIASLVAEASAYRTDLLELRRWLLRRVGEIVPYESAVYLPHPVQSGVPAAVNKEHARALHGLYAARPAHYARGLHKGKLAAAAGRGAYLDTDVYTARERDRLPFYRDIVRPQGIRAQLHGLVTFHGHTYGSIFLCRHGRVGAFEGRDVETLRELLPPLALVHAAWTGASEPPAPYVANDVPEPESHLADAAALDRLSPRERTIADYAARGLRNAEIAAALGTSPHTVHNQLAAIYRKLEVTGRVELTAMVAVAR